MNYSSSYANRRTMKALVLLLFSFPTFAEFEFEISKFQQGLTCEGMVGTWYTDVTVNSDQDGLIRHITRMVRNADGSAQLKGLSIYISLNEVNHWAFPSEWSCDEEWYTEKNEWGYTSFKIVSLGTENTLEDAMGNLGHDKIKFIERASASFNNQAIEQYFQDD